MVDEKLIGEGLLINPVTATAAGIFFGLRAVDVGQHNAILTSTLFAWLMSLSVWKR